MESTLQTRPDQFCRLIVECVQAGLKYRKNKGNPLMRGEVDKLNGIVARVGFKIPELLEKTFLESLPKAQPQSSRDNTENNAPSERAVIGLRDMLLGLSGLEPQARGYAFEKFMKDLFATFGLEPRGSFRMAGEQIDGSFLLNGDTYLVEARWQNAPVALTDLLTFQGKVEGKAAWSRGLFVSYGGFSQEALDAFSKGRSTSIVGFTGEDLYTLLDGSLPLAEVITTKVRRAAETGQFLVPVRELFLVKA